MKLIIAVVAFTLIGCVGSHGVPQADTPAPDPAGNVDPCLGKGAVGVMKILTSQDCEQDKPKTPVAAVCGNKIIEPGEACELENPKCDSTCKLPQGSPPPSSTPSTGSVTIKTKSLDVAYQGKSYTDYIEATCKPAPCNYALKSGTTIPKNFLMSTTGKLTSAGVVLDVGAYPISVFVQNKDGSQSATQDLTLTVKKHLQIKTFVEGFSEYAVEDRTKDGILNSADFNPLADYSDSQSFIPITKNGKLIVHPSHYSNNFGCVGDPAIDAVKNDCWPEFGWVVVGVNFKDPIDIDLSASSDADANAKYTWSVKGGDGKDLPGVEVGQAYSSKLGKQMGYMLFIKPLTKNFSDYYKNSEFNNVKITVSDDKGNEGALTISSLLFEAPLLTKAVLDQKKAEAYASDPCNKLAIQVTKVTINEGDVVLSKPLDITLDKKAVVKITVSGGHQPNPPTLTSSLATADNTGYSPDSEYLWQLAKDGNDGAGNYTYQRIFRYGKKPLTEAAVAADDGLVDTLDVSVTDPTCGNKKVSLSTPLAFNVHYPSISDAPPSPMRIRFGIGANDTDEDNLTMRIMDDDNKSLYGNFAVGGQSSLSLDPVGDEIPSDCDKKGDDTYCNTAEDATLEPLNGAIVEGKMPPLMTHANLFFHVDTIAADDVGKLDVRFHSMTVYGRYWYATFSDTGGSYDNITSNEKSDSTSEGTYDASLGKLSWHRVCVPNYDDDQKYEAIKFHCPK